MVEFDDFRNLIEETYKEMNKDMSIRIDPPKDIDKFHMLVAIDTYFVLKQERIAQNLINDMFMDYEDEEEDWDDFFKR